MEDLIKAGKEFFQENNLQEICFKGLLIYLEKDPKKPFMYFRTTVFSEKGFLPLIVRACVDRLSQKTGRRSLLIINEKGCSVDLVQKVGCQTGLAFDKLVHLFAFSARSWAMTLKRMAGNDLEMV
ncbi:MAG: hypothetical protein WC371_04455 [Parachlamydiales bacterium]|jgi:hypothetical protein